MNQCVYRLGVPPPTSVREPREPFRRHLLASYNERTFAFVQRRSIEWELDRLVTACREKLVYSLALIYQAEPSIALMETKPNLDRMILPWDRICVFYRGTRFDPQIDLFEEHASREDRRWREFIDAICTIPFTTRPEWTRSLLEAAEIIPPISQSTCVPIEERFDTILNNLERNLSWPLTTQPMQ